MEYWECRQQLADRCACEGALCTARRSPAIPYRRTVFLGQKLPIPPSSKAITADTPVEYFDPVDLPIAPVTAGMMPSRYTARAHTAVVSVPLTIVIIFSGRPRDGDIVSRLRALGHTVHAWNTQISSKMHLTEKVNQE